MKLKTKFLVFLFLSLMGSLALFVVITLQSYSKDKINFVKEGAGLEMARLANQVAPLLKNKPESFQDEDLQGLFMKDDLSDKYLVSTKGDVLITDPNFMKSSFVAAIPAEILTRINTNDFASGVIEAKTASGEKVVSYANVVGTSYFVLQSYDVALLNRFLILFLVKITFAFIVVASCVLFIGFWVIAKFTQGLESLSDSVERFGQGDFQHRVKTNGSDEVSSLGSQFNLMAERIFKNLHIETEKARLLLEVETAQKVQETLFLPGEFSKGALHLAGFYEPATECGGDWWFYFEKENCVWVCIGDVTGHGVGAAMLTSSVRSTFSLLQTEDLKGPAQVLEKLNRVVYETVGGRLQMTFFLMQINVHQGWLKYSNASHEFPVMLKKNQTENPQMLHLMEANGPRLGERLGVTYSEMQVALDESYRLIAFSDGIYDVKNSSGKKFGEMKFLKSFLKAHGDSATASQVLSKVLNDLKKHRDKNDLDDDLSLVCVDIPSSAEVDHVGA